MATATAAPANSGAEFLFTADFGSCTITAFRINGDGSLSLVRRTGFVSGEAPRKVAALGGSLIAAGEESLVVYSVDRDAGSLGQTDSIVLTPLHDFVVDAAASFIYAAAGSQIFGYRLADGTLQPLPGSPYSFSAISPAESGIRAVSLMPAPSGNSLQVRFRVVSAEGVPASLLGTMPRNADGSLGTATALPDLAADISAFSTMASRTPVLDASGQFAYQADSSSAEVFAYRFEAGKLMSLSPAAYPTGKKPVSLAVVAP